MRPAWGHVASDSAHDTSLHVGPPAALHADVSEVLFPFIEEIEGFQEKAMATHYSTLTWETPWIEKPGRLQSAGS